MPDYRRRLPHFHPQDAYVFLTWRLWGTLPLRADSTGLPTAGHAFVVQDRAMDRCAVGPLWLRNPHIANLVAEAILIGEGERRFYELCAWVVMPNHVHLLILPQVPGRGTDALAERIDRAERQPNPGRTGQPFWQDESLSIITCARRANRADHSIHRGQPGFAGLARSAECWPWSSAGWQAKPPAPRGLAGETACPTKPPR